MGRGQFFENCQEYISLWVENFDEIALSRTVKEIKANLCFAIFGKYPKIQNGRHFWGGENFLKIAKSTFLRYPVGRKFRRNRSILHDQGDRSDFVFCHLWQKFENSKWSPVLGGEYVLKNEKNTSLRYPAC